MKTTLLGSRLMEVFVEVRPRSTLRIDLDDPLLSGEAAASLGGVTSGVWFIGMEAACDMVIDSGPFIEFHNGHQSYIPAAKPGQKSLRTLTEIGFQTGWLTVHDSEIDKVFQKKNSFRDCTLALLYQALK
ncbi:hypothetical protein RRF56_13000 [Nodosilinea sp. E11]|nr:hypothetical protein [Nodosilinea sp. E11]WOD42028.1 hypothetical protein RRF56_13000 [Nodosilinea sp. E11]